jgi:AraC-like DNA-binding protein
MDVPTQLTLSGTAEVCHALITPPKSTLGPNPAIAGLHTRPRLGLLGSLRPEPPSLVRGGLPPQVLRRVREYVDTHVHRNIDLETLASTAQLSVYHFARAFKQSTGVTPHGYSSRDALNGLRNCSRVLISRCLRLRLRPALPIIAILRGNSVD